MSCARAPCGATTTRASSTAHCCKPLVHRNVARNILCCAEADSEAGSRAEAADATATTAPASSKATDKSVKNIAQTFAPRASGNTGKNPAVKGSVLYDIFTYQAWLLMAVGGLLSWNVIFPSDKPDIARLMGMWSVWMFTIPSLRARECTPQEKEWLNYAFLLVPLVNVTLPLVWKSFAAVYTADCVALAALFYWKVVNASSDSEVDADSEQPQVEEAKQ